MINVTSGKMKKTFFPIGSSIVSEYTKIHQVDDRTFVSGFYADSYVKKYSMGGDIPYGYSPFGASMCVDGFFIYEIGADFKVSKKKKISLPK